MVLFPRVFLYLKSQLGGHSITTWTRWGGGEKNVCFCPHSGYKNCSHMEGGGVKNVVMCWMTPRPKMFAAQVWKAHTWVLILVGTSKRFSEFVINCSAIKANALKRVVQEHCASQIILNDQGGHSNSLNQFGILRNLQKSHILQISNWKITFWEARYPGPKQV